MIERPYRGRFAPSPTGPLHFGSLIAAVGSYCDAHAVGGTWLLRIEDVDGPRTRPGADALILRTLERYGFAWDGPVMYQSLRTSRYGAVLAQLQSQGDVFPCVCTRREISRATKPIALRERGSRANPDGEPVYPGTCRARRVDVDEHDAFAWRLRVDRSEDISSDRDTIRFSDRLQGAQTQQLARDVGDFVVRRADSLFAYQLAVVVDDADQGITDVVRGTDLLTSTARQIFLQQRLGLSTPRYLHLPVAVNAKGEKLSKQTHAAPLPHDPLPTLRAAWEFLGQTSIIPAVKTVPEFWAVAIASWNVGKLPAVRVLATPSIAQPDIPAAL